MACWASDLWKSLNVMDMLFRLGHRELRQSVSG